MAHDTGLTFAATVGHLVSAIIKLAAVATPEEASQPLYRAVRGELPRGFWVPDDLGVVCATDTAFMSTSRSKRTPIDYMGDDDANVLWELSSCEESDSAYHVGADISRLSQFAAEQEVLFPPCSMLTVVQKPCDTPLHPPPITEEGGKRFVAVGVQPSFV